MISIVKVIVEYCRKSAGKRGELKYGDTLPAPKFSSSCMVLKYLSSRVLLFRLFGRFYSGLFRVSMDLWRKPVGDERRKEPVGDCIKLSLRGACLDATWQSQQNKIIGRDPHVSPLDFLRMTIRVFGRDPHVGFSILLRMTISKIGRSLDDCLRNRGMTIKKYV